MTQYDWNERTDDGPRFYRATRFARRWRITTMLKSDEGWTELPPPWSPEILASLRTVLWNKYQRRRVPFEVVTEIDILIDPDAGDGTANPR